MIGPPPLWTAVPVGFLFGAIVAFIAIKLVDRRLQRLPRRCTCGECNK